jgi:hypothetical protein
MAGWVGPGDVACGMYVTVMALLNFSAQCIDIVKRKARRIIGTVTAICEQRAALEQSAMCHKSSPGGAGTVPASCLALAGAVLPGLGWSRPAWPWLEPSGNVTRRELGDSSNGFDMSRDPEGRIPVPSLEDSPYTPNSVNFCKFLKISVNEDAAGLGRFPGFGLLAFGVLM